MIENIKYIIRKYMKTLEISMMKKLNEGILPLIPDIVVKLMHLIPLIALWHVLAGSGVDVGMTLAQMLSYAYMNTLLSDMLVVQTFASSWCYEGELQKLFTRPMTLYGDIIAETVGSWMPQLLVFTLPMLLAAPVFGISLIPASPHFFLSLLLCISLGFAIDFIFACIAVRMHGFDWIAHVIRIAITSLLSGTVIPFRLLPDAAARILELQPFGSLGGAPLSLFAGTADVSRVLTAQLVWNLILWPVSVIFMKKTMERMVSFGG